MFYFKKAKKEDEPDVDMTKVHSTLELHFMRQFGPDLCSYCSKKFKEGDALQLKTNQTITTVCHIECEKKEDKIVA